MQLRPFVLVGLVLGCGSQAPPPTASPPRVLGPSKASRWTSDLKQLDTARKSGDARTALGLLTDMRALAPNNAQLPLVLARVAAERNDLAEATSWLAQYAAQGLTLGGDGAKLLGALARDPRTPQLAQQLAANARPVGHAQRAFALPTGDKLFEDLAWDPKTHRFYLSSVRDRRVYTADAEGHDIRPLTEPEPRGVGVVDVAFDTARRVLWITAAPLPPVPGYRKGDDATRPSSVAAIDITTGEVRDRIELPPDGKPHALTDLALTAAGDVLVSDATGGGLYIIRAGRTTLERLSADFNSPQTPAPRGDGIVYVPDYALGIARVELQTGTISWLSAAPQIALSGIDGLYATPNALIAIQNGTQPPRVVRFALSPDGQSITAGAVLAASPELGDPTHAAVVDDQLWFLGNSGWSRFADDGALLKSPPDDAPAIWRVPLPAR